MKLCGGNRDYPEIALTFDGDWLDNTADKVLHTLKSKNIHSTFFLTGRFIHKYPDTAKQIVADGHEVGNHTMTHPLWAEVQEGTFTLVCDVTKGVVAQRTTTC